MMSVALAAAVAHARKGGWWRGALVCVLLALCLSMHPVVGMIGVGLIGGVSLLNPGRSGLRRFATAAVVVVAAFGTTPGSTSRWCSRHDHRRSSPTPRSPCCRACGPP